jgi:hypothetical protein
MQPVAEAHYWYYIMELGFYLSLLLCVSVDVKRKFSSTMAHSPLTPENPLEKVVCSPLY